jgi:phosphatidylserine/phosphatidylglycerophosphate/cardiolipin synthase-like enzyme
MLDIDALVERYFARLTDNGGKWEKGEAPPEQQSPDETRANRVEAFVDGLAYFGALEDEIDGLLASSKPGRYFYLTAWWLGLVDVKGTVRVRSVGDSLAAVLKQFKDLPLEWTTDLDMDGFRLPKCKLLLLTRLQELVGKGVDVRVLAWSSPFAPKYKQVADQAGGIADLNLQTLLSVAALRKGSAAMAKRVVVNLLAHPFGGAHLKMVLCGDGDTMRAYTSGLDPASGRLDAVPSELNSRTSGWHDVAVRVQGPGALAAYRFYQRLWNEQISRSADKFYVDDQEILSHAGAEKVADRTLAAVPSNAGQRVQVLRTVPQMNFSMAGPPQLGKNPLYRFLISSAGGFKKPAITFAPNGFFEFKVALKKAIANAQRYVFIADQAFWGLEIMDWLNARLKANPNLKVILLHGADPADPPSGAMAEAINKHLLPGLELDLTTMEPKGVAFYNWSGVVVHSKVTIVDDLWCAVGSANCMRRSLYTDMELSVSVVDGDVPTFPQRLRRDLWARYCGMALRGEPSFFSYDKELDDLLDLDKALGIWDNRWGARPNGVKLHKTVIPYVLPMASGVPFSEASYDLEDPDSRKTF